MYDFSTFTFVNNLPGKCKRIAALKIVPDIYYSDGTDIDYTFTDGAQSMQFYRPLYLLVSSSRTTATALRSVYDSAGLIRDYTLIYILRPDSDSHTQTQSYLKRARETGLYLANFSKFDSILYCNCILLHSLNEKKK